LKKRELIIALLFISNLAPAQMLSNLRTKDIVLSDSVLIDTLSLVPNQFFMVDSSNNPIPDSLFNIDLSRSLLYLNDVHFRGKKVHITYRVFPVNFSATYPEINGHIFNDSIENIPLIYQPETGTNSSSFEDENKLVANGTISRGVSIGNSQNLVVNSNLNLQLTGNLSNNLQLEAFLSDKNIPVQPDGYTQQIQEFDQVYIRLHDSTHVLQMGDVQINSGSGYFMQFNRKVQGADFTGVFSQTRENNRFYTRESAAIAKGSFNRYSFTGIEGVQGPYPLYGAHNETYIVVLSGSERIYLDGLLLERGENADYVMNYNTAEITFSPKVPITKDSRIIAEYEYSDRNYNRFLAYGSNEIQQGKGTYSLRFFSEGDAKNQPVNQELTDVQKLVLQNAGDDLSKAIVPNFDSIAFDKNQVLYKRIDTLVNGIFYDSIFVQSNNPDSAFYQVGFALVGDGNGNYVRVQNLANGKVYRWVAPLNGIPQGIYEPVHQLVAPQKQQMITARTDYRISDRTQAVVELAISNHDLNTFSSHDASDNTGFGIKSTIEHVIPLNRLNLITKGNYEWINRDFNAIERFRPAEFERDWNMTSSQQTDEHLFQVEFMLMKKKQQLIDFETEYLNRISSYQGIRNNFASNLAWKKFSLNTSQSLLLSHETNQSTQFYRHNLSLKRTIGPLIAGIRHEMEENRQQLPGADSLIADSRKFSLTEMQLSTPDSLKRSASLNFKHRNDFLPNDQEFKPSTTTNDIGLTVRLAGSRIHNLNTTMSWRELKIDHAELVPTLKDEHNFLGRFDDQLKLFKKVLSFSTFYEVGTGLETKKEYSYLEVAAGQGVYIWNDYNGNGIPELNEFEVSPFPEEANYIRIYTPTNEYIKVYALKFNETIKLDPGAVWRNSQGIKKWVSKFSNVFTYRVQQKHTNNSIINRLDPFQNNLNDTSLINTNLYLRNTLSFNRISPVFGVEWSFSDNRQKSLLVNGFDQNMMTINQFNFRWNMTQDFLILDEFAIKDRQYHSDYSPEKNYKVAGQENKTTVQWQPTTRFRTSVNYTIKQKDNRLGTESVLFQEAGPEVKISSPGKGTLTLQGSIISTRYNGESSSSVAYEMMEGYQNGENYKWSVNVSQNLNKYLQLSINYIGRKPADSSVIHTGQVTLSALF